jgi:hypothetical protein
LLQNITSNQILNSSKNLFNEATTAQNLTNASSSSSRGNEMITKGGMGKSRHQPMQNQLIAKAGGGIGARHVPSTLQ